MDERVKNGGLAAAVTTILLIAGGWLFPEMMETVPSGLEAAIVTLLSTIFAYFKPRTPGVTPT